MTGRGMLAPPRAPVCYQEVWRGEDTSRSNIKQDNIKIDRKELGCEGVNRIHVVEDRVMRLGVP
jgi:hypothetical protein